MANTATTTVRSQLKIKQYRVIISPLASQKIHEWTRIAPGEISGLGVVDTVKNDDGFYELHVNDVYLIKQRCTGSDTELDDGAVSDLFVDWMKEGNGKDEKPIFWWHSHVNMNVFWSGTDDKCVENLITGAHDEPGRFLLSTVVNKKGEFKTRIDFAHPFHHTSDNLQTTFHGLSANPDNAWNDTIKEFAEKFYELSGQSQEDAEEFFDSLRYSIENFCEWSEIKVENNKKLNNRLKEVYIPQEVKDFCKAEYDAKVTNQSATPIYAGYRGPHKTAWQDHWNKTQDRPTTNPSNSKSAIIMMNEDDYADYWDQQFFAKYGGM